MRGTLVQYPSQLVKNMGTLLRTCNGRNAAYSQDPDATTQKADLNA
jgi:hypothetical protein